MTVKVLSHSGVRNDTWPNVLQNKPQCTGGNEQLVCIRVKV